MSWCVVVMGCEGLQRPSWGAEWPSLHGPLSGCSLFCWERHASSPPVTWDAREARGHLRWLSISATHDHIPPKSTISLLDRCHQSDFLSLFWPIRGLAAWPRLQHQLIPRTGYFSPSPGSSLPFPKASTAEHQCPFPHSGNFENLKSCSLPFLRSLHAAMNFCLLNHLVIFPPSCFKV